MNCAKRITLKSSLACSVLVVSVLLTSCIDYVQTISYKDGMYRFYFKATLSKVLFAIANEDPEDIFDGLNKDAFSSLPENVEIRPVNTDLEVGAEFALRVSPRTADAAEKAFLPTVAGKKCFIPFLPGNKTDSFAGGMKSKSGGGEDEAFTKAILSSAKCRVMVGKNIIPTIEAAYFEGTGGQNCPVPVFDYGETWCMEIPFIVLFEDGMYRLDRIVVIRGG